MLRLAKTNLTERAAEEICAEIRAERWAIGAKMPNEAALCAMLAVSRGTVREAVKALVARGYLETRQGSGTYVLATREVSAPLSMARRIGLRDQFEARLALEVEAARLAALRPTPGTIERLRALLAARGDHDDGDLAAFIARDLAFHAGVVAASGNRALIEIYDFFSVSIAETIEATLGEHLPEPDMQAHASIVDAIASQQPAAADAAVRGFMAPIFAALDRLLMS